uniref:Uncharacterized protein n=1 Tax=Oryza meridionalis TaxID=40149 RepID=A0A0E0CVL1_9ORYZ
MRRRRRCPRSNAACAAPPPRCRDLSACRPPLRLRGEINGERNQGCRCWAKATQDHGRMSCCNDPRFPIFCTFCSPLGLGQHNMKSKPQRNIPL